MLLTVFAAALAVAMIVRKGVPDRGEPVTADASASEPSADDLPTPREATREEVEEALAELEEERLALRTAYRAFAENARRMTDEEKAVEAQRLLAEVDAGEERDELVGDQPLMMRLAIFRVMYDRDEAAFARAAAKARADRAAQVAALPPVEHGPLHDRYKEREARILREVLAMESYPDGLSRDAYLARRLAEARAEIYGAGEGP